MLQNPMGADPRSAYYTPAHSNTGNQGIIPNNIQAYLPAPPQQQQQQRGTRSRAVSNASQIPPPGQQGNVSDIKQWQSGVQASQYGGGQPPADQRGYPSYPATRQGGPPDPEGPDDPGPKPYFEGISGLSKKEKKAILQDWQRKHDEYEAYKMKQMRSQPNSRYGEDRYQDYGGGVAFPKSGQESNPPSDIERTMRRLTLNTRPAQETAAAQRQYERGRKISGGVLGLSGSTNQQEAYMNQRQGERSRSRPPNERARPISQDFSGRQLYMPTGGSNISGADPGLMDTSQPGVVPRPQSQYVNPNTMAGGDRPMNISQYMVGAQTPASGYVAMQPQSHPQPSPIAFPGQLPGAIPIVSAGGIQTQGIPIGYAEQYPEFRNQVQQGQLISPIDPSGGYSAANFLGNPMNPHAEPTTPARKRSNISEVVTTLHQQVGSYGYVNPVDKTLITPGPPPRQLPTANINNFRDGPSQPGVQPQPNIQPQSQPQPNVQTRPRARSQSNYPAGGVPQSHTSSHYHSPSDASGSTRSGPRQLNDYPPSEYMQVNAAARPPLSAHENGGLPNNTGSRGFGVRPPNVKQPSYKAAVRDSPSSEVSQSRLPKVSLRPPRAPLRAPNFPPQIITYDLNSEHRQEDPLRFGKFIYDRDVQHDEWNAFREQVLTIWSERNPAFNYYHHAVKRIAELLSAWNYAFFNPRGMDLVLFKGDERRSGSRFGEPEPNLEFLPEAGPVSEPEDESSSDDEEDNPSRYVASQDPRYLAHINREKEIRRMHRQQEKLRDRANRPLEAPHSLVIYQIPPQPMAVPGQPAAHANESYR